MPYCFENKCLNIMLQNQKGMVITMENTGSYCGLDCSACGLNQNCDGCKASNGRPFGGDCVIAGCCRENGGDCSASCRLKAQLIAEFNALGIEDMETVTDLNALRGSFVNLAYTLPGGQVVKFWNDDRIYLGNQICKKNSERCYGLTADENYLLVCEYGENGSDAEIVVCKRRSK